MRASVVLPEPGGPKSTSDGTRSASIASRSARPGPITCSWPTNSSSVCGRSRRASGATSVEPPPGRLGEEIAHCAQVCSGRGETSLGRADLRSPRRRGRAGRKTIWSCALEPQAGRAVARARERRRHERAPRRCQAGAEVTTIDGECPIVESAPRGERRRARVRADVGSVEHLPYDDASFDVLASDFGLIYAEDHAERRGRARARRAAGRAARLHRVEADPKLGELYRRFTDEPLEGRESSEWGREEHVELMLGEDFELDVPRRRPLDRRELGRGAVGALLDARAARRAALLATLDDERAPRSSAARSSSSTRATATATGVCAPRRYLLDARTAALADGGAVRDYPMLELHDPRRGVRGARGVPRRARDSGARAASSPTSTSATGCRRRSVARPCRRRRSRAALPLLACRIRPGRPAPA